MEKTCEVCGETFEAERPSARFCGPTCRSRAHRRQTEERAVEQLTEALTPVRQGSDQPLSEQEEQEIRDGFGFTPSEQRSQAERQATADRIVGRSKRLTEDEYVRHEVEQTKLYIQRMVNKPADPERLARAEAYARWRYRGFLSGEVASL